MGSLSPWHIIILVVLVLIVFGGGGKLSGLMGDAAKGIRAFRDGLKNDEPSPPPPAPPPPLPARTAKKTRSSADRGAGRTHRTCFQKAGSSIS